MNIFYQNIDITDMVQTRSCIIRDGSGKRCDSLELEFDNAAGWYGWGPQEDDQIIVSHNGYDSGVMYLNTVHPENGIYRILATSLPCSARAKGNKSFVNKSIEDIMRMCAMETGMDFGIFGIDPETIIPYVERENESCAAFLQRLMELENASFKCINGRYTAIGYQYAQSLPSAQTLYAGSSQEGVKYKKNGNSYRSLTVRSPYAQATAQDLSVPAEHAAITLDMPVLDNVQAGRWARASLYQKNRMSEEVKIQNDFNAGLTAMARLDIDGDTDASGEWLIEEVEHDLINLTSLATLRRSIYTIE